MQLIGGTREIAMACQRQHVPDEAGIDVYA
jgi:hypothetical protein